MHVVLQAVRGNVLEVITEKDQRGQKAALMRDLDLEQVRFLSILLCCTERCGLCVFCLRMHRN